MKITYNPVSFKANKISLPQAKYIDKTLKNSKSIDIICHDDTDMDSARSAVTMYEYLKQKGVNSRIIISQDLKSLHLDNNDCNFLNSKDMDKNTTIPETALCLDFSSSERMNKATREHLKKIPHVLCIDHHKGVNLTDHDYTYINKKFDEEYIPESVSSFYIDSTAKSATAVLYRFFEALDEPVSDNQAYSMLSGLISDGEKRGLFTVDGVKGAIREESSLYEDEHTLEIYESLRDKVSPEQFKQILKEVDITSNLNEDEKNFQNSLIDKIELGFDGKLAYVIIPPGDEEWEKIGKDNPVTSAILNKFRKNVLNNSFNDDRLNKVKIALVFYEADDKYKVSFHSKIKLDKMYDLFNQAFKKDNNSLGGHSTRGGGRILSKDKEACDNWVQDILLCATNSILRHNDKKGLQ